LLKRLNASADDWEPPEQVAHWFRDYLRTPIPRRCSWPCRGNEWGQSSLFAQFVSREGNSILQSDRRVSRKSGLPSNQAIAANVQRLKDELRIRKEEMLTFAGVYRPREVMFASGANQW